MSNIKNSPLVPAGFKDIVARTVLTFVIDVSGSMSQENRLGLVKQSLGLLMDKLDERDSKLHAFG